MAHRGVGVLGILQFSVEHGVVRGQVRTAECQHEGDQVRHVLVGFGIKLGESTPDNRIYLKVEEECLAACSGGPMMQVDHVYHTNLTPETVDEILDGLK